MDADAGDLSARARRQMEELNAAIATALAVPGICPVSVMHRAGCEECAQLIDRTLAELAEQCRQATGSTLPLRRGPSDSTTFFFDGPGAPPAALMFTGKAAAVAKSWWIITPAADPVYHRAE
jgi:hypothetical protein